MAQDGTRKLSIENMQQHDKHGTRKASVSTRDSSEADRHNAHLSLAHRRMSRMDPSHMGAMNRRMSMYRRPSIATSHRTDQSAQHLIPMKLENTYRTEPNEDEKFNSAKVQKVLHGILESFLDGEEYEPKKCAHLAQNLTDVVKSRMKEMPFPRYKFVCNVLIGQQANQALQVVSRCVWDTSTDNFAQANFKSGTLFAIATVHGLYFE